jgi:integrase
VASLKYRRGAWELRYRERSGKQRCERFHGGTPRRAPEEALDRHAQVERDLRRGSYLPRELRETTFGEYYDSWLASRRISRARAHTDAIRARLHVLPRWSDRPLGEIRPSDVDDWIGQLSRRMGPDSVRHCYTLFRGPIRRAVRDGIITDPLIDVALPAKRKIRKGFDDVLTRDEVTRLVGCAADHDVKYAGLKTNDRYRALILMGCWLGPRWNEAIGVRVCDLNPLRKEISFGRVVVNQNDSEVYVEQYNKTDEYRTVPVPGPVMEALTAHIAAYCPGEDRERFLFLTRNMTHPLRRNFGRDVLRPALRRAGLGDRRITWLSLRHTAASLMFDAGLTIFDVQQRLGHHSPNLTAEIYTHLMRERYDEGRKAMEEYMRNAVDE